MPKENKNLPGHGGANDQEEKFRTFFSTSVAQVPEAMTRREQEEDAAPSRGLFGRLFRREKAAAQEDRPPEIPTGEIFLGEDEADSEPVADLELVLKPEEKNAPQPAAPAPHAEPPAAPEKPAPAPAAPPQPAPKPAAPEKQSAAPEPPEPVRPQRPQPEKRPQEERKATPLEVQEIQKMDELKALLRMSAPSAPPKKTKKAEPPQVAPQPPQPPETPQPLPETPLVFAEEHQPPQPEPAAPPKPPQESGLRMFGAGEDETPHSASVPEDTMSLPLIELEPDEPAAPAPQRAAEPAPDAHKPAEHWKKLTEKFAPEAPAQTAAEPEAETEPDTPEDVGERLRRMGAAITLRCVLSGILAVVLLHFGLAAAGLLPPVAGLDPVTAPTAFYGANLLLLAAACAVGYSVLRDGLNGLRGRPSADTMPALSAVAALIQAAVALLNAASYSASNLTLLSGIAALGLFFALLGSRVMLSAVQGGYELAACGVEHQGAYRVRDKDLIRSLARDLEEKDPWVLLSRPVAWSEDFVEQSFSERASERRARKTSYILLGAAVLAGLLFLLFGAGVNGAAAALTSVLCLGAPFSSNLVAGVAALRLQRTAAAVGAVVPGWAAIEELGGVDTVQVDADELFTPESVNLEDIRIFKGGRIDRAILYTASVLNQGCNTLRGLFRQIIEDRTDILFPVKDLESHRGLGFSAWCDNNRILIGNRAYLEREGVALPEPEYEQQHSRSGELQILYLAVSGSLHAMFVLRYVGGRNAARSLSVLQKENIRLLVTCQDPSLTARHIAEAYHLPDGMVTLLDQQQCDALEAAAPSADGAPCCMLHLKGFASLTGGLRAAGQAQTAETAATTVQLVSVWFSVAIAVLLTTAGSIGTLSVAAALMYQAAWSALSIAVCALKQHR